jgi:hypothetical protein
MAQTITINLPDTLYKQLQQTAKLSRQSLEEIVTQSLAHSLPPLLKDIPAEYQADVYPLLQMSEADLQQEANQTFAAERWTEYETLLDKKKLTTLTIKEQARLDELRREADVVTFRKGYAAVLLKRSGYYSPTLRELAQAK